MTWLTGGLHSEFAKFLPLMLPQARSAREGELYVWFLCSCTSLAFERRFLEILERTDHFYAWQLGDWLRIALARFQAD
jgi:hypothetical protein